MCNGDPVKQWCTTQVPKQVKYIFFGMFKGQILKVFASAEDVINKQNLGFLTLQRGG